MWWPKNPNLRFGNIFLLHTPTVRKVSGAVRSWERRMFWGVFSRLTDSCRTSRGRSANTPSDAQPSPWGTGHTARHDKAQGLFAALAGGLTFLGHRSEVKETLPEGRPFTTLAWKRLVKGLQSQNNTYVLPVDITFTVTLIIYNKHTWLCFFWVCYRSQLPRVLLYSSTDATFLFFI